MALLALHFSKHYKEKLVSGKKRHTTVDYALNLNPGTRVLIFLSETELSDDSPRAERIGTAIIKKALIVKVKDLTDELSKVMGHDTRNEMIESLKKWYKITNSSTITHLEFEFEKSI